MCILFLRLLKAAKGNDFKFILASNRDESFRRPAKSAGFWEEDGNIVGGRDMTENKEGGTWLAMSKRGKVGVLLNVTGESVDPNKLGRGFLVVDYLQSERSDKEFLAELSKNGDKYNKYHLVTANFGPHPGLHHYSNGTNSAGTTELTDEILGISNSSINTPFEKAKKGRGRFEEILKKYGKVDKKEQLAKELLSLLQWNEKHYPDQVLDLIENVPLEQKIEYSAVCVKMPKFDYGTRTHTVILVDANDQVDFYEWTLKEPIDIFQPQWVETHLQFKLVE